MRLWLAIFCLLIPSLPAEEISLELLANGLSSPSDIQAAHDGSNRLFVVEQPGRIRVIRNGQLLNQPFLDIQDRVVTGSERGLLGLAFAPWYRQSGRFYVNYTGADGHTVISMFDVSADPDIASADSEVVLLTIDQPFANHNGGQLQFGTDGMLYIASGDGGSGGDPNNNGQSLNTLLGKLLRVDVESQPGMLKIPSDNPFVGTPNAKGEIWAYGLRNPWRFSFDAETAHLWIADVGQNRFEEVNRSNSSSAGLNYGWRRMEGLQCFEANCDQSGLTLPVHDYSHALGCSVTGGYVYRGSQFPGLRGTYIYGDYCSGLIWGIDGQNQNRLLLDSGVLITTFGKDEAGELYVADGSGQCGQLRARPGSGLADFHFPSGRSPDGGHLQGRESPLAAEPRWSLGDDRRRAGSPACRSQPQRSRATQRANPLEPVGGGHCPGDRHGELHQQ